MFVVNRISTGCNKTTNFSDDVRGVQGGRPENEKKTIRKECGAQEVKATPGRCSACGTQVETGADSTTQSAVWDHLLKLQPSFFRRFPTGDLQSRVSAISQIRAYLSGTTLRGLFSSVVLLLNFGLLLYHSPTLTLVALIVALASAAPTVGS
jgi:hypothetical protein